MVQRIPGIPYAAAPSAEASASVLSWPPRLIVVHDTGNPSSTKENEASYAHTRPVNGATTAHAYVDNGGVLGSLRLDRQAWAAYGYANAHGLHIEMCLRGDRAQTRKITAALVRQLCQMAAIPMVKLTPSQVAAGARGVCGHRDITIGLGVGDHTDPGVDFPWAEFMAQVTAVSTGGFLMALSDQEQRDMLEWVALLVDPNTPLTGRTTDRFRFPPLLMMAAKQVPGLVMQVTTLTATVQTLADALNGANGDINTAAVFRKIDEAVAAVNAQVDEATAAAVAAGQEARDAVGDLGEGGADKVRADADAALGPGSE